MGRQRQERGRAMNRERTFEMEATTANAAVASSADLDSHLPRARKLRSEAIAAAFAGAFGRIDRSVRALVAGLARWYEQRRTRDALMRCSDRVLADIGIEREHIPLVAKGLDPAECQLREPALRRCWAAARARMDAALGARRERRRLYRELDVYSDRELEEIGLRRADIPLIARGRPILRHAA
jgi:uncharacterized protein YjiS (DUF1127 family)